jgi:hypothetical protein
MRVIVVLAILLVAARVGAQELPAWLRVRPSQLAYQWSPQLERDRVVRKRSAWMVAVGAGLAAGATAYLATQGDSNSCSYDERRIKGVFPIGIGLTAAGVALAGAGGIRMARVPRALRPRRRDIGLMAMTSVLTAAAAWWLPIWLNPDTIACIN